MHPDNIGPQFESNKPKPPKPKSKKVQAPNWGKYPLKPVDPATGRFRPPPDPNRPKSVKRESEPSFTQVPTKPCRLCGNGGLLTIDLPPSQVKGLLQRRAQGEMVQDVFPMLNADERELLISGTHAHCWESMMRDD